MDERGVPGAEVVEGHLHSVPGQPGERVGGPLRVLQQHVFRYLQLQRPGRDAVPGEPGRDAAREPGGVDVARGDVDRDRDEQPLRPPPGDLGQRGLQDVFREMRHEAGRLGDGDELVRRNPAAFRMHPAHQGFEAGHLAVEADLRLVVELDLTGVQGAAQIAQQPEPVRGVAVPLGLVDLDARTVPLGLVHRHVRTPEQPLGVQRVVRVDGDSGTGLQYQGQSVEVQRGGQLGDQMAGDPLGAGGGVRGRQEHRELIAAQPRGLRAPGQGESETFRYLQQQPVPRQMTESVVDRAESVEVDQDESGSGTDGLGVLQGRPGALQQPLPVGQPRQRVAQLLLGPGPGDPEGGVEGDQRDGEERQEQGVTIATTQISGAMATRARATRPWRSRAVRAMVGSPPPCGVLAYHSRTLVTTR